MKIKIMGIENKKNNIKKEEAIEEAEIIEETKESPYPTCKHEQCGYFGGGHLKSCPSLAGKEKIDECALCGAFDGHASYCDEHPANKQEAEIKKLKEEKEFSFSEPKKTSEEILSPEKSSQKKSPVELPERINMEFRKLEKLILNTFSNKEINEKIAYRILDDYFAEMKFHYDNDKNLKNFNFEEDKYSLVATINNKYADSDFMDILSESGYGFGKNSINYDKKEKESGEFISELAKNAVFEIFEIINMDKDCGLIKLEKDYKGMVDLNIKEKIEKYTEDIISKRYLNQLKNGDQFESFFKELLKKEGGALGKYYSHILEININAVKKNSVEFLKKLNEKYKENSKAVLEMYIKYEKVKEKKKTSAYFIEDAMKIIEKKLREIYRREGVIYNSI